MPDDLTLHFRRLTHAAALVAEFEDRPERQAELLAWVLEAVRAIAAARGLELETGQPEPLPQHISRDLWPGQGEHGDSPAPAPARPLWNVDEDSLAEQSRREVTVLDGPRARTTIEAGAGFAPGELRRPDACDPAEDGAERVMQAAETWWGRR